MLEKQVEKYLVQQVEKLGGIAYKFKSPQRRSVPDRLCVFPEGVLIFIEVKATGKEPTDDQWREINRLRDLEQWADWVDSKPQVRTLLKKIATIIVNNRL